MNIHHDSYKLGAADCFCEMVRAGVKRLALSHPCGSREERDRFLPAFEGLCAQYGVKMYREDTPLLTDLFPVSMNKGKYNVLFYQDDETLQAYLQLKEEKRQAQACGAYTGEKRREIARRYGRLLSYTEEGIARLLAANQEKESAVCVLANGGGSGPCAAEAYRRFGLLLDKTKPLLYIPLAMEPAEYPSCLEWATAELAALQVPIRMAASPEELASLNLPDFCGIFIGGGNTYTLAKRLKDSGAFAKLLDYIKSGGPVFGGSAGAILLGADIAACRFEDENLVDLQDTAGLDVLHGLSLLCHYESGKAVPALGRPVLALREEQTLLVQGDAIEMITP